MDAIAADLAEYWYLYLAMPVIAAVIGYVTKLAAIEMMFRPLRFRGIKPFLGWQGVVPRHGARMASIATDLLTKRLIDPKEVFLRIDPDQLTRQVQTPLLRAVDEIAREVLQRHHPELWEALPTLAQDMVVKQVQAGTPQLVAELSKRLRDDIDEVLDVRDMAVNTLTRDRELLVRLVREVSRPEMAFIARTGIYFGFVLGIVQAVVWGITKEPWVLPIFGGLIGLFTDWLAIKLIFLPRRPVRIGRFTMLGKFQQRRHQVARQYGEIIAREVMTVPNIVQAILHGPHSDRVVAMVQNLVQQSIDRQLAFAKPVVAVTLGSKRLQEIKRSATVRALDAVPSTVRHAEDYLTEAMDIAHMISERMLRLTPEEYEGLLRPAFRQDEWKLITVGALIGFAIGELQVLLLLH
ncbi:uncharacterized membrane protein YheB (UPF0754 family) [Tamaricihabitans halophyticus]|uniref:Uncharacterized membrane protein YheB (UPF0754 family) n=1 Tax=Tamaricihabitans halophyticus TaxID=1262583 RepID=A0A4R2R2D8_9PSEU|nr:DUF445 domain-containing protein [Tamaricihabitans halophyticus]TCP56693.1 uncharacterized membrane protein YheB (UPF0754 family) [Tamaricihabitans halophyticus]